MVRLSLCPNCMDLANESNGAYPGDASFHLTGCRRVLRTSRRVRTPIVRCLPDILIERKSQSPYLRQGGHTIIQNPPIMDVLFDIDPPSINFLILAVRYASPFDDPHATLHGRRGVMLELLVVSSWVHFDGPLLTLHLWRRRVVMLRRYHVKTRLLPVQSCMPCFSLVGGCPAPAYNHHPAAACFRLSGGVGG
jgi:hypothetical protein